MKILHYCQHVLGIGHFFRSMEIARALRRHEVLFVEGGEPLPGFVAADHVTRAFLPAIMMDADFQAMAASADLESLKARRQELLLGFFRSFQPDVLLIEMFPFGRRGFRFELLPLLEEVRRAGRRPKVVCSLRDILVEKENPAKYEQWVASHLNRCFDLLLVHSDPRVVSLEETFERVGDIRIPIKYTGFVVRLAPARSSDQPGKDIVASSGGGKVGRELLAAAITAVRSLSDVELRLTVFTGPFMDEADAAELTAIATGDHRISVQPFSLNFPAQLAAADLSISMAGYNTCMDILAAGVRALVYPFRQNREQTMRARKLEGLGLVRVLEDLNPQHVAAFIREALVHPLAAPEFRPDLSGAVKTALFIENLCGYH
jgi:predicted glycosyltransferase